MENALEVQGASQPATIKVGQAAGKKDKKCKTGMDKEPTRHHRASIELMQALVKAHVCGQTTDNKSDPEETSITLHKQIGYFQ